MASNKNNKLISSILWNYGGKIGKQIWGIVVSIILARKLGPSIFGAVSISLVIISIFSFFISSGMFSALIQAKRPNSRHYNTVFLFNIIISIVIVFILCLTSSSFSNFLEIDYDISEILNVLSSILIISAFTQVQEVIKIREMSFDIIAKASFLSSLISGLVALILVLNDFGIWSLVTLHISEKLVFALLIWFKSNFIPKLEFHLEEFKELWKYGSKLLYSAFLENLIMNLDSIVISKYISITQLGFYNRAKTLNNFVVRYATNSSESVLFSKMSTFQDDFSKIKRFSNRVDHMISFVTFLLLGLLYVSAEGIIISLLGEEWRPSVDIFKILCLSGFSYPLNKSTLLILKSAGFSSTIFKLELKKNIIYLLIILIGFSFSFKTFLNLLIVNGFISVLLNIHACKKHFSINFLKRAFAIFQYLFITVFICVILNLLNLKIEHMILRVILDSIIFFILYISINFLFNTYSSTILNIYFKKTKYSIFI